MERMEQRPEAVSIVTAVVAFAAVMLLSIYGGEASFPASIGSGLIAGLIAFSAVEVFLSRRLISTSSRTLGRAYANLQEANKELESGLQSLRSVKAAVDDQIEELANTSGRVCELVSLGVENLGLAPDLKKIAAALPQDEDVTPQAVGRVIHAFHRYAKAWEHGSDNLSISQDRDATLVWTYFLRSYLGSEAETISAGRLHTSPRIYTRVVTEIARCLHEDPAQRQDGSKRVILFLATAMLPSEFFNWPQAEMRLDSRRLEFVPHTWQGVEEYIASLSSLSKLPGLKIRRCILVSDMTEPASINDRAPYIHSLAELQEQAKLHVLERPMTHSQLSGAQMTEMLMAVTGLTEEYISEFAGVQSFEFYPIATEDVFEGGYLTPSGRLLDLFVDRLHSDPTDATYYSLGIHQHELFEALFRDPDHMPEIAMFGIEEDEAGTQTSHTRWLFGIVGYLRPFTEYMQAEFVVPSDPRSSQLLRAIDSLDQGSVALKSLLQV